MKNLLIFLLLFAITACADERAANPAQGAPQFRTTPPSHLYFKNLRSHRYEQTTQSGTRIDLYRYDRFSNTDKRPMLIPVIVDNWMQDEAYLLIRPNPYEGGFPDTLRVKWRSSRDSGQHVLGSAGWPEQYTFAKALHQSLLEEHELQILDRSGGYVPLFDNPQDRNHFLTTMRDYYRLTEKDNAAR